jgi:hypothetical protein
LFQFIACGRDVSDLANNNEFIKEPTNNDLGRQNDDDPSGGDSRDGRRNDRKRLRKGGGVSVVLDGAIVGAVGASAGTVEQHIAVAEAAIAALHQGTVVR